MARNLNTISQASSHFFFLKIKRRYGPRRARREVVDVRVPPDARGRGPGEPARPKHTRGITRKARGRHHMPDMCGTAALSAHSPRTAAVCRTLLVSGRHAPPRTAPVPAHTLPLPLRGHGGDTGAAPHARPRASRDSRPVAPRSGHQPRVNAGRIPHRRLGGPPPHSGAIWAARGEGTRAASTHPPSAGPGRE